MRPLLLADWKKINRAFCAVMWSIALVLAIVVIAHATPSSHSQPRPQPTLTR
jgi:hypothetical protein